jgi:hypothetical protein
MMDNNISSVLTTGLSKAAARAKEIQEQIEIK